MCRLESLLTQPDCQRDKFTTGNSWPDFYHMLLRKLSGIKIMLMLIMVNVGSGYFCDCLNCEGLLFVVKTLAE